MRPSIIAAATLATAALFVLAGCGGDDAQSKTGHVTGACGPTDCAKGDDSCSCPPCSSGDDGGGPQDPVDSGVGSYPIKLDTLDLGSDDPPDGAVPGRCNTDCTAPGKLSLDEDPNPIVPGEDDLAMCVDSLDPSSRAYTDPMIDGVFCPGFQAHQPAACYGACGAGCNGRNDTPYACCVNNVRTFCPSAAIVNKRANGMAAPSVGGFWAPVGCTATGNAVVNPNGKAGFLVKCYATDQNYTNNANVNNRKRQQSRVSAGSCPATDWTIFGGGIVSDGKMPWDDLGAAWRVQACSTHPACWGHDECNRHDWRVVACQVGAGINQVGVSAMFGTPNVPFTYGFWTTDGAWPLVGTNVTTAAGAGRPLQTDCTYLYAGPGANGVAPPGAPGPLPYAAADLVSAYQAMTPWPRYTNHNFEVQVDCPVHHRHHCKTGWFGQRAGCPFGPGQQKATINGVNYTAWFD